MLRLHPGVPQSVRFAKRADVLPDGTVVPAGAMIIFSPYAMGRDARLYADPPASDPERFVGRAAEPSPFEFSAFGAGPRACLGKPLALMEMKLVTALLLRAFDIELETEHAGGYTASLMLTIEPGLFVRFRPRDPCDGASL